MSSRQALQFSSLFALCWHISGSAHASLPMQEVRGLACLGGALESPRGAKCSPQPSTHMERAWCMHTHPEHASLRKRCQTTKAQGVSRQTKDTGLLLSFVTPTDARSQGPGPRQDYHEQRTIPGESQVDAPESDPRAAGHTDTPGRRGSCREATQQQCCLPVLHPGQSWFRGQQCPSLPEDSYSGPIAGVFPAALASSRTSRQLPSHVLLCQNN